MSDSRQSMLAEIYMMSEGRHDLVDKRIEADKPQPKADLFEMDKGEKDGFGWPCWACIHRDTHIDKAPCKGCVHYAS